MRLRVVLVTVVVAALIAGAFWWWQGKRTAFEDALQAMPAEILRATYTDWAAVNDQVGSPSLEEFVAEAYDLDLSRTSALESTAVPLEDVYGIDLRAVAWEVYGQSGDGSVAVLKLTGSPAFDELRTTLKSLGYTEPDSATGAWAGGEELLAAIDPALTSLLQSVVLLEGESLVLLSDSAAYAEHAAAAATGDDETLLDAVGDLAAQSEAPVAAVLWAADYACEDLAMSTADTADQDRARALVDEAGGVTPLDGLLMAVDAAKGVRVALQFESADQAEADLQPRTDLAGGEAPGLGRTFPDRFSVTAAHTDGRLVVLDLEPAPDETALLSSISDGPVLFATC